MKQTTFGWFFHDYKYIMSFTKKNFGDYNIKTIDSSGNTSGNIQLSTENLNVDGNLIVTGFNSLSKHPGYQPNRYYTSKFSSLAPTQLQSGVMYVTPFYCAQKITWTKIGFVLDAGVPGSSCRLGVFSNNNGKPVNLVADVGTIDTDDGAVGPSEITDIEIVMDSGWSWLAIVSQQTPSILFQSNSSNIMGELLGLSSPTDSVSQIIGNHTNANGMPQQFPQVIYNSQPLNPHIWVRL